MAEAQHGSPHKHFTRGARRTSADLSPETRERQGPSRAGPLSPGGRSVLFLQAVTAQQDTIDLESDDQSSVAVTASQPAAGKKKTTRASKTGGGKVSDKRSYAPQADLAIISQGESTAQLGHERLQLPLSSVATFGTSTGYILLLFVCNRVWGNTQFAEESKSLL